jgi:pyridoxine/pyridoxamine 5'-phosphate oxidase
MKAPLSARFRTRTSLAQDRGGCAVNRRWIEFWAARRGRRDDRPRDVRAGGGAWRVERPAP